MEYMRQALELAEEALSVSHPNPPVGAVVVKDGKVAGRGHTMHIGGAHAEVSDWKGGDDMDEAEDEW